MTGRKTSPEWLKKQAECDHPWSDLRQKHSENGTPWVRCVACGKKITEESCESEDEFVSLWQWAWYNLPVKKTSPTDQPMKASPHDNA